MKKLANILQNGDTKELKQTVQIKKEHLCLAQMLLAPIMKKCSFLFVFKTSY